VNRTFLHYFDPASASPVTGPTIALTTEEIEDAGLKEVLQTPGAAFGSWSLLDALLEPTGADTPFVFKEPLGHAREVKVALSGLFGRFVARAYLEKYLGLSVFAHMTVGSLVLDGGRRIRVVRRDRGDLPDWLASTGKLAGLTVAEAKGCHDISGATKALGRAWLQANRIDVVSGARRITLKRIAVATRWGAAGGGAGVPIVAVRDPEDPGDATAQDEGAACVGVLRLHVANLIAPLGHIELAQALLDLASGDPRTSEQQSMARARRAVDTAVVREISGSSKGDAVDGLIGGIVSRAGPLGSRVVAAADQEALARLALRPVFVGVERSVIRAAIEGHVDDVRQKMSGKPQRGLVARTDGAGGWIVPVGADVKVG
jgi:hypothetical protein